MPLLTLEKLSWEPGVRNNDASFKSFQVLWIFFSEQSDMKLKNQVNLSVDKFPINQTKITQEPCLKPVLGFKTTS